MVDEELDISVHSQEFHVERLESDEKSDGILGSTFHAVWRKFVMGNIGAFQMDQQPSCI